MAYYHSSLSAISIVVLLTGASSFFLSTASPDNIAGHLASPTQSVVSSDGERRLIQKRVDEDEEDDELFKDVDPKTLAAVLLEALNNSYVEKKMQQEGEGSLETKGKMAEADRQVRTMEKGADRDRDGRHEIELLMAAQGREQQKKEEEERKKAQEEEEKMTERVTSHTTSQKVQVQTPRPSGPVMSGADGQAAQTQQTTSPEQGGEVEEQLNPEELKNLETVMKEFPRLNTATKREGDLQQNQRESRGYSSYNEILPVNKGSEKKLKWQEETQKALSFPSFRGGNFMDDFEEGNFAGGDAAQPLQELEEKDEPKDEDEEEDNEEVLSPEEEEAQAKAEQEEMRRQAAEAQKAKMEEEKLADIASDMLLRYMVKQNNGNRKFSSSLSNAAEDKRSEEDRQDMEDEDIDPQTIDKLIEISSKLHLPADDVVDIISDVEKKKKKDLPPETFSYWRRPQTSMSDPALSNSFLAPQTKQTSYQLPKPPPPSARLLKSWFQDKSPTKSQERWGLSPGSSSIWPKQKSIYQEPWLKSSAWNSYPRYPYPYFYQRKYSPVYYPLYYPSVPRSNLGYYFPKTPANRNSNPFPPRRRYQGWIQPRLRQPPPSMQHNPYYATFPFSLYPRRIQPLPKPHSPPLLPAISSQKKPFYYSAPAASHSNDYYEAGTKPDGSNRDNLEKYIQQILMTRPLH
ncbi:neurosecretory protein VGF [Synchiropus splendidus]|uniref:neurosecretory protein VGF n=1 Tax=Synchiropus splendidus TaxID=270530 RepID=UPI00237E472C|nr:neurosecretory protein VGF [Synchiropus splendidus]